MHKCNFQRQLPLVVAMNFAINITKTPKYEEDAKHYSQEDNSARFTGACASADAISINLEKVS